MEGYCPDGSGYPGVGSPKDGEERMDNQQETLCLLEMAKQAANKIETALTGLLITVGGDPPTALHNANALYEAACSLRETAIAIVNAQRAFGREVERTALPNVKPTRPSTEGRWPTTKSHK